MRRGRAICVSKPAGLIIRGNFVSAIFQCAYGNIVVLKISDSVSASWGLIVFSCSQW